MKNIIILIFLGITMQSLSNMSFDKLQKTKLRLLLIDEQEFIKKEKTELADLINLCDIAIYDKGIFGNK